MIELHRLEAEDHSFSLEKAIARTFLPLLVSGIPAVRPLFMEEAQVRGIENLVEEDGTPLRGPALWLIKHESRFDFVAAPLLWKYVPGNPLINGVSRDKYARSFILSWMIHWLMKPLFFETYRLNGKKDLSEADKRQLQDQNQRNITKLRDNYHQGIHAGIAPEGVSKSDGRIAPIRSGAYNLSHITYGDRVIERVPCIPIGNTYDFMVGEKNLWGRRKYAVFFNFGRPFFYDPVVREDGESNEEYIKRDIQYFAERVELAFLDLNTITASQIIGDYLLRRAEQKSSKVMITPDWIDRVLARRVEQLIQVRGLYFDGALLDNECRRSRSEALHEALQKEGYLSGENSLFLDVVCRVPESVEIFKDNSRRGNILLYSANRLRQVAEVTPAVDDILKTSPK